MEVKKAPELPQIDQHPDTFIQLGCHREIWRLGRMMELYQHAVNRAHLAGVGGEFIVAVKTLHDHKGVLSVVWNSREECDSFRSFVEDAWQHELGECIWRHYAEPAKFPYHDCDAIYAQY